MNHLGAPTEEMDREYLDILDCLVGGGRAYTIPLFARRVGTNSIEIRYQEVATRKGWSASFIRITRSTGMIEAIYYLHQIMFNDGITILHAAGDASGDTFAFKLALEHRKPVVEMVL
jgi:hypothetical protein